MKKQIFILNAKFLILAVALFGSLCLTAAAQTTVFTYQGRFVDASMPQPTNSSYEMQFKLFDVAQTNTGAQIGGTNTIPSVSVVNGIFTVQLNGGNDFQSGADIFVEIGVRPVGSQAAFTILAPRQQVTSAPYALRARSAAMANDSTKLGGIDADQYVTGQVVRSVNNLTNNVTLAAGSNITITPSGNTLTIASTGGAGGSDINNQTSLQANANFNIDGTGAAKIFNATQQFNLGGNRVLSAGTDNLFAGVDAGTANTTGVGNSFVGARAGTTNTTGIHNSFFGSDAGRNNAADYNSFNFLSSLIFIRFRCLKCSALNFSNSAVMVLE